MTDMTVGSVRLTDPDTAHAAAMSVNVTELEQAVAEAIKARGAEGATWHELEVLTGINRQTISPRFAPLRRKQLIKDSGTRRRGTSTRAQIVWVAA